MKILKVTAKNGVQFNIVQNQFFGVEIYDARIDCPRGLGELLDVISLGMLSAHKELNFGGDRVLDKKTLDEIALWVGGWM